MFGLSELLTAFTLGWAGCALAVGLGGWITKLETKRDYVRIRREMHEINQKSRTRSNRKGRE